MSGLRRVLFATALLTTGCGRGPFARTLDGECGPDPDACTATLSLQRAADILFVIDNSGSMGDEQGTLALNFESFIRVLEGELVGASYRIGVTGTGGVDSQCSLPVPQGELRATSCLGRLSDFLFSGDPPMDEQAAGCLSVCQHGAIDIQPTSTDLDPDPKPRPWLEKGSGTTNLPSGIGMVDALQCVGPQGINGCGFEAPLESMRGVIELSDQPSSPQHGFIRQNALLAVIFVTDEADCSIRPGTDEIFSPFGNRVFWSTPDDLTSAICWNAGVECVGEDGVYESCDPVDRGVDGQPSDPDTSVLYPVQRYVDFLRELAETKRAAGGNPQTLVAVLAGVPEDFPQTGEIEYARSDDEEFNDRFGIGPGCNRGAVDVRSPAIPPVRLRDFAAAFEIDGRNMFSICSSDYAVALEQIATAISQLNARACVDGCVRDRWPGISGFQPACQLEEADPSGSEPTRPVPPCAVDGEDWDFPDDDVDVCFRTLTDRDGGTEAPTDDMSPGCVSTGTNLELVVERRPDVPVVPGTTVEVTCDLHPPDTECPRPQ